MNRLASPAQLRASFVRWALFLVPAVMLLGFLSGRFGSQAQDPWFLALEKPVIFPPSAIFGVVWPILYVLMGFAAAMICAAWGSRYRLPAILAFVLQLLVNLAWTPVFFGEHEMTFAIEHPGHAVWTVAFGVNAFVPIVIRRGAHLALDFTCPGIFARRLIKMAVNY